MKFINDCDSIEPIEINLPYFNTGADIAYKIEDLKIAKTTKDLQSDIPYEVVIIGGGLSGVSFGARLNKLGFKNIAIIENNGILLENFINRTRNINQKVMRSSYKHHIGPVEQISLADFGRLHFNELSSGEKIMLMKERKGERSIPSMSIFLKHSAHIIKSNNLINSTYRGRVESISRVDGCWKVGTDNNMITAKIVILATGNIEKKDGNNFSNFSIPTYSALTDDSNGYLSSNEVNQIVINGSGNTAAHIIHNALNKGKKVHWVMRSKGVFRCMDIPNEFWRTEGLASFNKLSIEERFLSLQDIYHGSAMPEHMMIFKKFIKKGSLIIHEDNEIINEANGQLTLKDNTKINCDALVLSYGLQPSGLPKINPAHEIYKGFPILNDSTLEWSENFYVGSSLAALSLGPAAKNIDGMRLAIEKIFNSINEKNLKKKYRMLNRRNTWGTFGPVGKISTGGEF